MTNLPDGFDAEQQKPMASFEAIPKADYLAMAIESEMMDTSKKDGRYLQFTWEIIDGEYKGRNLWSRLNLENKSTKAVEIAQRELGDICKACKVLRPKDSSELHGIPVILKVGTEKRKDNGELTNRVKGYAPASGTKAPTTASATAVQTEADMPPWA